MFNHPQKQDIIFKQGSSLTERNKDQISDIVTGWRARWTARIYHKDWLLTLR